MTSISGWIYAHHNIQYSNIKGCWYEPCDSQLMPLSFSNAFNTFIRLSRLFKMDILPKIQKTAIYFGCIKIQFILWKNNNWILLYPFTFFKIVFFYVDPLVLSWSTVWKPFAKQQNLLDFYNTFALPVLCKMCTRAQAISSLFLTLMTGSSTEQSSM